MNVYEKSPDWGSFLVLWAFFAWTIREVGVRSELVGHARNVFFGGVCRVRIPRVTPFGVLCSTESLVFATLGLFHFRGIDALEIEQVFLDFHSARVAHELAVAHDEFHIFVVFDFYANIEITVDWRIDDSRG